MWSPYLFETEETVNLLLFALLLSPGVTVEAAKLLDFIAELSVPGTAVLIARFLLTPLGLVGLTAFSLFLGLRIVGDETGDLALSFFPVTKAEGLSGLIFFMLAGSLSLASETIYPSTISFSIGLGYFTDFMLLGSDFSDLNVESIFFSPF